MRDSSYSPFPLETDAAALGFVTTTVSNGSATIVARHPAARSGDRATLLLHGAAGSWTTWTPVLAAAAELGIELGDTVLFDLPGWGDATSDVTATTATLENICNLVSTMAARLGYSQWDLVGHSMGGLIAMHLAATRPEYSVSVRLVSGTGHSVIEAVRHPWRWLFRLPGFVTFRVVMLVLSKIDRPARTFVRFLARVLVLRGFVAPLFRHAARVDRSVIDALGVEVRPIAFVAATEEVRDYDLSVWSAIACPVSATRGDRDRFSGPSDFRWLTRLVPQARAVVIADCGHFGNVERPFEVVSYLYADT